MGIEEKDARAIHRLRAESGRVDYSPPIVLHESSQRRIVLVPFYIRRSEGGQLAAKIQSYRKAPPPNDWILIDEKSISLNEEACRALLRFEST